MKRAKVTIVTVTYNCESEIEETILSVLGQDWPELEYIVIDGASKDGTLDVINRYRNDITTIISEPDHGLYDAMNKAVAIATGEWCGFLNAGDTYLDSHTVSTMFECIEKNSDKRVVYGNTELIYRDGHRSLHDTSTVENLSQTIGKYQPYTHQAVFYNISHKDDCKYDLRYHIAADYDVACRYWKRYGQSAYHYTPITVCFYKAYDGISSSPKNKRLGFKERILIKIRNHMNPFETIKDIIKYTLGRF